MNTESLIRWYRSMAACWLAVEPPVRRRLMLATHHWIVDAVMVPLSRGEEPRVDELVAGGALHAMLARTVPDGELSQWRFWVWLAVHDLRRALAWSPERRSDSWARWLFLIPYSIPVGAERRAPAAGDERPAVAASGS